MMESWNPQKEWNQLFLPKYGTRHDIVFGPDAWKVYVIRDKLIHEFIPPSCASDSSIEIYAIIP